MKCKELNFVSATGRDGRYNVLRWDGTVKYNGGIRGCSRDSAFVMAVGCPGGCACVVMQVVVVRSGSWWWWWWTWHRLVGHARQVHIPLTVPVLATVLVVAVLVVTAVLVDTAVVSLGQVGV